MTPARPLVIAVVGRKGSGKTKLVEALVRGLSEAGYRVSTAKHIPEEEFSIDVPGKDTWRHAEAGAMTVTLVAPREISTIKRLRGGEPILDEALSMASRGEPDILIMEGFKSIAGLRPDVLKIVLVSGMEEAEAVLRDGSIRPILAFVGPGEARCPRVPYVPQDDIGVLVEMVRNAIEKERPAPVRLVIDGVDVRLNRFVREMLKKLILAFASCLKGVDVRGDEHIEVHVRKVQRGRGA